MQTYSVKKDRREQLRQEYYAAHVLSNRNRPFVAWDGEGYNACGSEEPCGAVYRQGTKYEYRNHKPGCQRYALLKNSVGHQIINFYGLGTKEALEFIGGIAETHPDAINVCFGASYDVNMILKDIRYELLVKLQKKKMVYWGDYRIAYIPRKYFQVSKYQHMPYVDKRKRKPMWTVTLWDVIGFFQGSFIAALEKYFKNDPNKDELQIEKIKAGKARRGSFTSEELETFIIPYTALELKGLVKLMNRLRDNMLEAGIEVSRWDGAGAAAEAILRKSGVKKLYAKLPEEVELAAQVAYGGGRVEMLMYGYTDEYIWHYDIISAYPSVMPYLPCLVGGEWVHTYAGEGVNMLTLTPNTLYKIYWDYQYRYDAEGKRIRLDDQNVLYPFFYRKPWQEPKVYYPPTGYSWVWTPELEAALKWQHKLGGKIVFFEKWQFIPKIPIMPFEFVRDLFKMRQYFKEQGMGAELALKLAINSLYGKTAQTVGYRREDNHVLLPPYYNLMYAGLITSHTRAKVFDAAMQRPDSIVAIATDGLWSTLPLDLKIGTELGEWEEEVLDDFTSIQAGVYFATKETKEKVYHYRGFNQGSISQQDVIQGWQDGAFAIPIPTQRFVTLGSAIASEQRFEEYWRVWDHAPRILSIVPTGGKRQTHLQPQDYHTAADSLIPIYAETPMLFQAKVKSVGNLTEEFLSKKHPLPWHEYTPTEEEQEYDQKLSEDRDLAEQDDVEFIQ